MTDAPAIIEEHVHLCGDCAMGLTHPHFKDEGLRDWLAEVFDASPVISSKLHRTRDITEANVGCGYCWSQGVNVPATFTDVFTIDGDG